MAISYLHLRHRCGPMLALVAASILLVGCADPERGLVGKIIEQPQSLRRTCESDSLGRFFVVERLANSQLESVYVKSLMKLLNRRDLSCQSSAAMPDAGVRIIRVVSRKPDTVMYEFQFVHDSFGSRLSNIVEVGGDLRE